MDLIWEQIIYQKQILIAKWVMQILLVRILLAIKVHQHRRQRKGRKAACSKNTPNLALIYKKVIFL